MRVLVIGRSFPDAATQMMGSFELAQAEALAARGHDIIYAFIDRRSILSAKRIGSRFEQNARSNVTIAGWYLPVKGLPRSIVQFVRHLTYRKIWKRVTAQRGAIDVVYAHYPCSTLPPGFIRFLRRTDIPLTVMEHWSRVLDKSLPRRFRRVLRLVATTARRFGCVSEDLACSVQDLVGASISERLTVIPNIVPDRHESARPSIAETEPPRFIAVGRLTQMKNVSAVVEAFGSITDRTARLTIVGDGSERTKLEAEVRRRNLESRIDFTGLLSPGEVALVLTKADFYVTASRLETFGVPIVESWLAGVPAIAPSTSPLRTEFTTGRGLLYDGEAADGLKVAMEQAISTRSAFDGEKIRRFARDRFGASGVAQQIESMLHEALDSAPPPPTVHHKHTKKGSR